jgi:hypothetical protein
MPATQLHLLIDAAACVAYLMNTTPQLPDRYVVMKPIAASCVKAGDLDGDCNGLFILHKNKTTTIIAPNNFSTQVHELCHLQQVVLKLPRSEDECYELQANSYKCFLGTGAPGMSSSREGVGISRSRPAIISTLDDLNGP